MRQNLGFQFGTTDENVLPITDLFFESIQERLPKGSEVLFVHYSDYGGAFLGKMLVAYFEKEYPENIISDNLSYNGKEAVIFGDVVEELREWDKKGYMAGFDGLEDFILAYEDKMVAEECDRIINEKFSDRSEDEEAAYTWHWMSIFTRPQGLRTLGLITLKVIWRSTLKKICLLMRYTYLDKYTQMRT